MMLPSPFSSSSWKILRCSSRSLVYMHFWAMKVRTASCILNSVWKFFKLRNIEVCLMAIFFTGEFSSFGFFESSFVFFMIQGCLNASLAESLNFGSTYNSESTKLILSSLSYKQGSCSAYLSYSPTFISFKRRFMSFYL